MASAWGTTSMARRGCGETSMHQGQGVTPLIRGAFATAQSRLRAPVRHITGRTLAFRIDAAYVAYLILGGVFGSLLLCLAVRVHGPFGSRVQMELANVVGVLSGITYLGAVPYAVYASARQPREWRLLVLGALYY